MLGVLENEDSEKFSAMERRGCHREWGRKRLERKVVLHVYLDTVGT